MQAFSRYHADQGDFPAGFVLGAILLAALAGATICGGPRGTRPARSAAMPTSANTRDRPTEGAADEER